MRAFHNAPADHLSLLPLGALFAAAPEPRLAARAACEPVRDDDPAAPCTTAGCGWFDSSFDLQQGLQVVELALPERWPFDPPPWARH